MNPNPRRAIPSVEKVRQALGNCELPRPALVAVVRRVLSEIRAEPGEVDFPAVVQRARVAAEELRRAKIQRVINGTGIIIHTNLGRAPLAPAAVAALAEIGAGYSNLEFDLATGERGGRASYLEHNLALLGGAEAATVVNNCAAALVLVLRHYTKKKREVIISRGELIQIGGGFRIPEILEASGAVLREIGTTNRTTVADYAGAIGAETGMILKVHRSNFFMRGFVEAAEPAALAALARAKRIPLVEDLGSGAIMRTESGTGLAHEPTPAETLKRGADLVLCSADKLMGGPQAGLIFGKARRLAALRREPFFRALRCDKLVLTALQTTIDLYLAGDENTIPVVTLLRAPNERLRERAEAICAQLAGGPLGVTCGTGRAQVGGGTLPESSIPSVTLEFDLEAHPDLPARVRHGRPAVLGYVERGKLKLDLRTIFPREDAELIRALRAAAEGPLTFAQRKTPSRE